MSKDNKKIEINEIISRENDKTAKEINETLTNKEIFAINVMGAPGAGKTSVIKRLIENTSYKKCYVLEGDIESDIDTRLLTELGIEAIQINTHGACHLDAPVIGNEIKKLDMEKQSILFIENIGNLVCPAEFQIGEHVKMLIVTVAEGSDKPYKYPLAFEKADIIILNKSDLLDHVDFDEEYFLQGVKVLNPLVNVIKVSSKNNSGFKEVVTWIQEKQKAILHLNH